MVNDEPTLKGAADGWAAGVLVDRRAGDFAEELEGVDGVTAACAAGMRALSTSTATGSRFEPDAEPTGRVLGCQATALCLEFVADMSAALSLVDGEAGDEAQDLQCVDGVHVIVAVHVAEELLNGACR